MFLFPEERMWRHKLHVVKAGRVEQDTALSWEDENLTCELLHLWKLHQRLILYELDVCVHFEKIQILAEYISLLVSCRILLECLPESKQSLCIKCTGCLVP